ncbi:molybdopterin-guanine dinucleotide biosynthesis protein MobA [Roseovarius sp. A-2]|uniref:nucleotidyltransferase family protein n=1 Tax=Roseovarius sp. A-2 TaxID=1570360 RepID=UPI0009B56C9E|nr:nucleotidyltransferase family protein [Roseovarius sp. A-2]GAW35021.1 molybdopterin-guanine dinucleotide biosynthesis protein MobA [Roseovarius sp. A-2]
MADMLILIPAAGASSRMRGRDKLLEEVRGVPLLRDRVKMTLGLGHPVLVTLPPDRPWRAEALRGLNDPSLSKIVIEDAATGLSASLRAGADRALRDGRTALMVLLPDLPDLTMNDMRVVLQAYDKKRIIRATSEDGIAGHPVIFPSNLLIEMRHLTGDRGAQDLLRRHPVTVIALPGAHATTDLDTPEAWAAWRARQTG